MKFCVKRLNKREEGYEIVAYFETPEQCIEYIKGYKNFYNPIDIYYCFA